MCSGCAYAAIYQQHFIGSVNNILKSIVKTMLYVKSVLVFNLIEFSFDLQILALSYFKILHQVPRFSAVNLMSLIH